MHAPLIDDYPPVTQGDPWSDDERARLAEYIDKVATEQALARAFPGRSIKAVKRKLSVLRADAGSSRGRGRSGPYDVDSGMLDPAERGLETQEERQWAKAARIANRQFVAILHARGIVYG